MTTGADKPGLLILGVHKASEGYPNVLYRIAALRAMPDYAVSEINVPFWSEGSARRFLPRLPRLIASALAAHVRLILRLARSPSPDIIYVPYPAVFILFLLSLLPGRARRARIVADAFISIHDTVVHDRQLLAPGHPLARLLHWIEKRAYDRADRIIVDTPENAAYLCQAFGLPTDKVAAVPLSTNEHDYRPTAYLPHPGPVRVLFIGTLIPLHGARTIVEAAAYLRQRTDIEFQLIGDGQDAPAIERLISQHRPNLVWRRDWHTPRQLAKAIAQADICLGIFGGTPKAQRVCPLKVYAYASVGRAIITGATDWLCGTTDRTMDMPFAQVPMANPKALADKIVELAETPAMRMELAKAGRAFYEAALSNQTAHAQLRACLLALKA